MTMNRLTTALTAPGRAIYAIQLAGLALAYFLLGKWGLEYASLKPIVSLIWPASGLALAVILLNGVGLWPGIALGAFLVNLSSGIGAASAALIASGNTLEALLAWYILKRLCGFDLTLARTRDVLALLLAASLGAVMAALFGSLAYTTALHRPGDHALLAWWMGDMTGILLLTPLILIWYNPLPRLPPLRWPELLLALGTALWVGKLVFLDASRSGNAAYPAALVLLPVAAWIALRFGRHGATALTFGIAGMGILGTQLGSGLFLASTAFDVMLRGWQYTTLVAVAGLLFAALRNERVQAWQALDQSHQRLEKEVEARTAHLQQTQRQLLGEMASRQRLERHLVEVGEKRRRRFGQDLHDGLGQYLTGLGMMSQGLALALRQKLPELAAQAERLQRVAAEAQTESKRLASSLYPVTLEKLGLRAAIEELMRYCQERDGVQCQLDLLPPGLPDLPATHAIHLYRIVQEALHNAVRHGKARHIGIELHSDVTTLHIRVRDDGDGFDPAAATAADSLGFHLMRQRAAVLGAQLEITSTPGHGSEISVQLPLSSTTQATIDEH
jgi:signal transduction histidine kinase